MVMTIPVSRIGYRPIPAVVVRENVCNKVKKVSDFEKNVKYVARTILAISDVI